MSINLVEIGEAIGEAQATAEAALEVAEVAEVTDAIEEALEDAPHGCGEDCPCRSESKELRAALLALDEKYNDDMEVIQEALDLLLSEGLEEAEPEEAEEEPVEVISPEEAEKEESDGSESTGREPGTEGHASAGSSGNEQAEAEAKQEEKPARHSRSTARARRFGFHRGRR